MLFTGWKLTRISQQETESTRPAPLSPLQPVYIGIEKRADHPRSVEWEQEMRKRGVVAFRDDKYRLLPEIRNTVKKRDKKHVNRLDKFLLLGASDLNTLIEITSDKPAALYPAPVSQETKLKALNSSNSCPKAKTKKDQKQRWGKIATSIFNCLSRHKGAVSQRTLMTAVIKDYPELAQLKELRAGKSTQTALTNLMAWAKVALKSGGYTLSKKDCLAKGEVLRLTEKGKLSNLNKASTSKWDEHYDFIKKGVA
jgi:hypothetical protein